MKRICVFTIMVLFLVNSWPTVAQQAAAPERIISLSEYISLAAKNDTNFDEILIGGLALNYEKRLRLPPGDLVVAVKEEHRFFLKDSQDKPATSVSLSKLFPMTGTDIEATYGITPSFQSQTKTSEAGVSLSQSIAGDAFGRATRMLDKIVGIEVDVARHQIVEAYEDYLASLILDYLTWYEAYENRKIIQSSYKENLKLLGNIKKRRRSKIALPIDVNKIQLQVLAKKEKLIRLEEAYQNALNNIIFVIDYKGVEVIIPSTPEPLASLTNPFETEFDAFWSQSRTQTILTRLEDKNALELKKSADDLFPSLKLLVEYQAEGEDEGLEKKEEEVSVGLSVEWPIPDQVDRASREVAKLELEKRRIANVNIRDGLYTDLQNLHQEIEREKKLDEIAEEKIQLAQSILKDETENYSFGKVTLNDYIQAVNVLDENRFNKTSHGVLKQKLLVDWLRLTDRLVTKEEINTRHEKYRD